jgi:amidase
MRFVASWPVPVDALFDAALATLKAQGATLVDIIEMSDRRQIGPAELTVPLTELKADSSAYLATTPAAVGTRTLADVIVFDRATPREMALFG